MRQECDIEREFMDFDSRLNRILHHLILRSFPRLRRRKITIGWGAEDELLYYSVHAEEYVIAVNRCLEKAGRRALGGIAHELCHIDTDLRLGRYQRELAWYRYLQSYWCSMPEERAAVWWVIELGYGTHLLEFDPVRAPARVYVCAAARIVLCRNSPRGSAASSEHVVMVTHAPGSVWIDAAALTEVAPIPACYFSSMKLLVSRLAARICTVRDLLFCFCELRSIRSFALAGEKPSYFATRR
jgi:hypothetical protein